MYVGENVTSTIRILVKDTKMYVQTILEGVKHLLLYVNNKSKKDERNYNNMVLSIVQNGAIFL